MQAPNQIQLKSTEGTNPYVQLLDLFATPDTQEYNGLFGLDHVLLRTPALVSPRQPRPAFVVHCSSELTRGVLDGLEAFRARHVQQLYRDGDDLDGSMPWLDLVSHETDHVDSTENQHAVLLRRGLVHVICAAHASISDIDAGIAIDLVALATVNLSLLRTPQATLHLRPVVRSKFAFPSKYGNSAFHRTFMADQLGGVYSPAKLATFLHHTLKEYTTS